jgi:hypothetical protein
VTIVEKYYTDVTFPFAIQIVFRQIGRCPSRGTVTQEIQRKIDGMLPALNRLEVHIVFRKLTTSLGMILLASSFAAAGQDKAPTSNAATQSQQTTATKPSSAGQGQQTPSNSQQKSKKHHKRHAKAKKTTTTKPQSR